MYSPHPGQGYVAATSRALTRLTISQPAPLCVRRNTEVQVPELDMTCHACDSCYCNAQCTLMSLSTTYVLGHQCCAVIGWHLTVLLVCCCLSGAGSYQDEGRGTRNDTGDVGDSCSCVFAVAAT